MHHRFLKVAAVAAALFVALPAAQNAQAQMSPRMYQVTLTNLSAAQPLSPPIYVTHGERSEIFTVGERASEGIRMIAENGNNGPLANALRLFSNEITVVAADMPLFRQGAGTSSQTIMIEARPGATRLSLASMLICTNDGFAGIDGIRLPNGNRPITAFGIGYDAGTEMNDELWTSLGPPCQVMGPVNAMAETMNGRTATNGEVSVHPGIAGVGNLTSAHQWAEPVIQVTIQRVR